MAVKIRLKRLGKIRAPYYRIVVADSRTKRDGRVIEEIGKYHPTENPSFIEVNSDRAQYWLGVGAQPTEQVTALLKLSGDWGIFKGEKGAKSTIQVAEPKPVFEKDTKKKTVLVPKVEKAVKKEEAAELAAEQAEETADVAEVVASESTTAEVVDAAAEETAEVAAEAAADETVAEAAADAVAEEAAVTEAAEEAAGEEQV